MSSPFDAQELERHYAFLDDCPDALFESVVTLPICTLPERVAGVRAWSDALLEGRLPADDTWPPAEIAGPVRRAMEEMGVARFCRGQPELVDALMLDVLAAFAGRAESLSDEIARRLRELEELERLRLEEERQKRAKRPQKPPPIPEETLAHLRARATAEVSARECHADAGLLDVWSERARVWASIAEVFGDLGQLLGRGWDLSVGVLRRTGWLDLVRLRQLIEHLPELKEIVRTLGRLEESEDGESVAQTIFVPVRRLDEELREVVTPHVPAEMRGVQRSADIARMLPVEASMLGHPKLKYLWHARRAERALLTYRVQGVEIERTWVEREELVEEGAEHPRPARGPIIAIVDTSGSMHGPPERVAKALVLEALRTAHAERRRCVVVAHGSVDEVAELELDVTDDGVSSLLSFLGWSFGGGTDTAAPLALVVEKLEAERWERADVLMVSDGEWPTPTGVIVAVDAARERGTRFHGVQIGNVGETGLHSVCDPVHEFRDWAEVAGWK